MNDSTIRSVSERASVELGERIGRTSMAWLIPKLKAAEKRVQLARTAFEESESRRSATESELFEHRSRLDTAQGELEVLQRRVNELQEELERRPTIDPELAEQGAIRVMDEELKASGLLVE